jgi:hypothetical protein
MEESKTESLSTKAKNKRREIIEFLNSSSEENYVVSEHLKIFHEWWRDYSKENNLKRSFGDRTLMNAVRALEANETNKTKLSNDDLGKNTKILERFIEVAEEFLKRKGGKGKSNGEFLSEINNWNIYLYHKTSKSKPKIAKVFLECLPKGKCRLYNVTTLGRVNFDGTFSVGTDSVITFLFKSRGHVPLVIKKYSSDVKIEKHIDLGAYITYEYKQIVTGTLIFEPLNKRPTNPHGEIIVNNCNCSSPQQCKCKWFKIPKEVRSFLSKKSLNYHAVPHDIENRGRLKEYLQEREYIVPPSERFLQVDRKPSVFLSSNTAFKGDKKKNRVLKEIKRFLKTVLGIRVVSEVHRLDDKTEFSSKRGLRLIEESDLFILFFSRSDFASFSMVELGCALQYCKTCLIFHEENSISPRILSDDDVHEKEFVDFSALSDNEISQMKKFVRIEINKLRK